MIKLLTLDKEGSILLFIVCCFMLSSGNGQLVRRCTTVGTKFPRSGEALMPEIKSCVELLMYDANCTAEPFETCHRDTMIDAPHSPQVSLMPFHGLFIFVSEMAVIDLRQSFNKR